MAQQHFKTTTVTVTAGATASAASQATTLFGAAFDQGLTEGIDVSHCEAVCAVLSAVAGQTITSGTLLCYVRMPCNALPNAEKDEAAMRWMRYPQLDYTVVGGVRDEPTGDKLTPTGVGRIIWLPDTMSFSGGSSCLVTHSARRRRG